MSAYASHTSGYVGGCGLVLYWCVSLTTKGSGGTVQWEAQSVLL